MKKYSLPRKEVYPYPSRFGSHRSMVIGQLEDGFVILKDEHGIYTTIEDCLDNGLADPRRYSRRNLCI